MVIVSEGIGGLVYAILVEAVLGKGSQRLLREASIGKITLVELLEFVQLSQPEILGSQSFKLGNLILLLNYLGTQFFHFLLRQAVQGHTEKIVKTDCSTLCFLLVHL